MIDKTLLDKKLTEDLIEVADQLSIELENTISKNSQQLDYDRIQELLTDWVSFKAMTRHLLNRGITFSKVSNPFDSRLQVDQTYQRTFH